MIRTKPSEIAPLESDNTAQLCDFNVKDRSEISVRAVYVDKSMCGGYRISDGEVECELINYGVLKFKNSVANRLKNDKDFYALFIFYDIVKENKSFEIKFGG